MTKHLTADERRGALYGLLSVLFFTANVLCLRGIALYAPAVDGWVGTFMRGLVGFLFLYLWYRNGRGLEMGKLFTHPALIIRGVIGAITIVILYITITKLGAGRAIILNLTYPLFGAILAALFMKEPLTLRHLACLIAGLAGLTLFLAPTMTHTAINYYDLLALVGAFLAAIVVMLIRHLRHTSHPSTIYASQCVWGVFIAAPLSAAKAPEIPATAWLALSGIALLVAGGQLLITHCFRHLSVAKGSGIQMLLPPFTAAGGMLFFGETYSLLEASGAIITLLATWFLVSAPVSSKNNANSFHPQKANS